MPVVRTLDRIRDGLGTVFTTRSAPDDEVEFDAALGFIQVHDENGECETHPVVYIWLALSCPEVSASAKSTCKVIVPLHHMEDPEEVSTVGTDLWEALQAHRQISSLGDFEDDEDEGD